MQSVCFYIFFLIPFLSISQSINYVDNFGMKQGMWQKKYNNGNVRYEGFFKDNKETGLFRYFYEDGSLKLEKIFFIIVLQLLHIFITKTVILNPLVYMLML